MLHSFLLLPLFAISISAYPRSNEARAEPSPTPYVGDCKWSHLGCWADPAGTRLLTVIKYYDDTLTVEKCLTRCEGYQYAMVEYRRECYCGDVLNPAGVETSASECRLSCMGDGTELCGGSLRGNLYQKIPGSPSCSTPSTSSYGTSSTANADSTCTPVTVTVGPLTCEIITQTITTTSTSIPDAQTVTETTTATTTSTESNTISTTVTTTVTTTPTLDATTITQTIISTSTFTTTITAPAAPVTTSTTCASPLSNGNFESNTAWTISIPEDIDAGAEFVTGNSRSGIRAFKFSIADTTSTPLNGLSPSIQQPITVCPGSTYKLIAWAKVMDLQPRCSLSWIVNGAAIVAQAVNGLEYGSVYGTWKAPQGITQTDLRVAMSCQGPSPFSNTVYLDDVSFEQVAECS